MDNKLEDEEIVDIIVEQLSNMFDMSISDINKELDEVIITRWGDDEFIRGSVS